MAATTPRTVEVTLPEEAFQSRRWEPELLARELRVLFLVEQVRQRRLAYGKAAELAEMAIVEFVHLMGQHGVGPFDLDPGELLSEVGEPG